MAWEIWDKQRGWPGRTGLADNWGCVRVLLRKILIWCSPFRTFEDSITKDTLAPFASCRLGQNFPCRARLPYVNLTHFRLHGRQSLFGKQQTWRGQSRTGLHKYINRRWSPRRETGGKWNVWYTASRQVVQRPRPLFTTAAEEQSVPPVFSGGTDDRVRVKIRIKGSVHARIGLFSIRVDRWAWNI